MVWVAGVLLGVGVYATEQEAKDPLPLRLQVALLLPLKLPALVPLLWLQLTVPVGVLVVPELVSATVAVHVVALVWASGLGSQVTTVVVLRPLTGRLVLPWLVEWVDSPP